MKKTLNLGLVLSILALLACTEDDNGPSICTPPCPPPSENDMTIYTMQPASGYNGDEITILVDNFPNPVRYEGRSQSHVYDDPFNSNDENSPWVEAYVGGDRADIVNAFSSGLTIEVPPFLDPGKYRVQLSVGSYRIEAPNELTVLDPAL
jgi:hypothetical protein